MTIDLASMTEDELLALNRRIVERLKFLQQARAHAQMIEFQLGDRVSFEPEGRTAQFGVIIRYNRKTVTVLTEGGAQWNVSPSLLRRVKDVPAETRKDGPIDADVLPFRRPGK